MSNPNQNNVISAYAKIYPNGTIKHIHYHQPYTRPDTESINNSSTTSAHASQQQLKKYDAQADSIRRTEVEIADIIQSNHFDLWCTFTFNGKDSNKSKYGFRTSTDRLDIDLCKQKMQKWLDNQTQLVGRFRYLIVPEYHKDGALHFHAFLGGYPHTKMTSTGKYDHGKPVYKFNSYKLGFSYIILIDQTPKSYQKLSKYLRKYITKDMITTKNQKRYWCSQGLLRPETILNPEQSQLDSFKFDFQTKLERLTIRLGTRNI